MKKVKKDEDVETKIIHVIDKIRPFLVSDGGNIQFIRYEDNIVYVSLLGACAGCAMIDITLKDGIEELIINDLSDLFLKLWI